MNTKREYYDTGELFSEIPIKNGKPNGILKKYDKSGNLIAELNCKNGIEDGKEIQYFSTGEIKMQCNWVNGKVEGKVKGYYKSGCLLEEFNYKNNLKNGSFKKYYDLDGFYEIKKHVKKGFIIDKKGKKVNLKTNIKGLEKLYGPEPKGKLQVKGYYKNSKLNGESLIYDEDGDLSKKVNYVDDKLEGFLTEINKSGTKHILTYVNDKPTAEYFYNDLGESITFEEYKKLNKIFKKGTVTKKENSSNKFDNSQKSSINKIKSYIKKRPKNILMSTLLILLFKIIINFYFFTITTSGQVCRGSRYVRSDGTTECYGGYQTRNYDTDFEFHITHVFTEDIHLFIPIGIIFFIIIFYFNDKIKAK